ncbi:hypothetical protein HX871_07125 [Pseudomonas reactans]|uniref:Uncharacterized protein n=1 Tax=Pseudomonas reactans TaxID=117680 RepID=A0ABX2QQX7_9PSED|nr:hypothetical protein [Pseudomonas reactans]NWA43845.1 hypothetical protein [Pseudomonas reactans]NWD94182.1 hypothetical protein [Pseudomonas reactans]NWF12134.1 hypothetical protein [Pseudomonas reactans]
MAKSVQERSAKAAQKRLVVAEKELRHKVRPGIEQAMERICARGKTPIISEVLQIAIMKMDLMGDGELIEFLNYPRHEIVISENVAREFHNQSLSEIRKDPGDEILPPEDSITPSAASQRMA